MIDMTTLNRIREAVRSALKLERDQVLPGDMIVGDSVPLGFDTRTDVRHYEDGEYIHVLVVTWRTGDVWPRAYPCRFLGGAFVPDCTVWTRA